MPIAIGAALSIPLAIGAFFLTQGVLTRANTARPQNVKVTEISDSRAVVTWTTDRESQGIVQYGLNPEEINRYAPEIVPKTEHAVELTLLTPKTPYYFRIEIGETVYDNDGIPWTFTTKAAGEQAEVQGVSDSAGSGTRNVTNGSKKNGSNRSGNGDPVPTLEVVDEKKLLLPTSTTTVVLQRQTLQPAKKQSVCPKTTNCNQIKSLLGKGCTSTEYVACVKKKGSVQGASTSDGSSTGSTHKKINTPTKKPTLAVPETAEE